MRLRRYQLGQVIKLAVFTLGATFLVILALLLLWLSNIDAANRRASLFHAAQTVMAGTDALVERYAAVGRTLLATVPPDGGDLAEFKSRARRVARTLELWIVLAGPDGRQILNTAAGENDALPMRGGAGLAAQRIACETRTERVSGVGISPVTHQAILSVNLPIIRDDKCFVLAVGFPARVFHGFMADLPDGWLAGLVDENGRYITRSLQNDSLVGTLASEGWRRVMRKEGISEFKSREGADLVNANVPSKVVPWAAAVAVRKDALYRPFYGALALAGLGGVVAIGVSLLLVSAVGRRASHALGLAAAAAKAVETSAPTERTGERDIDAILDALATTSEQLQLHEKARVKHQQQIDLSAKELNHRSKNLLAVISGMARFVGRTSDSLDDFHSRFDDRLTALALCQDLLIDNEWRETALREIVRSQVEPFGAGQLAISGPDVFVSPGSVQALSMIFHELATNAVKYGALSNESGNLDVSWTAQKNADAVELSVQWKEQCASKVERPTETGFGNVVITESIRSLGGTVTFDWRDAGLVCAMVLKINGHFVDP